MLTDVSDVVGVRVGTPVGAKDHSAITLDVVLEQPIPHLVCRQEVYLKKFRGLGAGEKRREGSQLK